jgi:hypothetical protein
MSEGWFGLGSGVVWCGEEVLAEVSDGDGDTAQIFARGFCGWVEH